MKATIKLDSETIAFTLGCFAKSYEDRRGAEVELLNRDNQRKIDELLLSNDSLKRLTDDLGTRLQRAMDGQKALAEQMDIAAAKAAKNEQWLVNEVTKLSKEKAEDLSKALRIENNLRADIDTIRQSLISSQAEAHRLKKQLRRKR